MKKFLPVIIFANVILIGAIIGAFLLGKNSQPANSNPTPENQAQASERPDPAVGETVDFAAEASGSGGQIKKGKVTGKLCYPSESLPAGTIEAKRIDDGKIFSENYPGSQNAGGNTYSLELETGKYNIRYKAGDQFGYHTTVCQSGSETTCSSTEPRTLLSANIEPNETVENFDLCDFYYSDKNAPYY